MKTFDAISKRTSIREYLSKPIDKALLEKLVDAGRRAPTARKVEPWEFIVATNKDCLQKLGELVSPNGTFIKDAASCIVVYCNNTKYYLEDREDDKYLIKKLNVDNYPIKYGNIIGGKIDITIDEFRVYDPTITSADVSQLWRVTTLWQVNSSAAVGEKLRWEFRNCSTVTWEPESSSDEYLKGTITFKLPATDASGNANIKIEHTHDAAKQALVAQASW